MSTTIGLGLASHVGQYQSSLGSEERGGLKQPQ
jgi:hypothetical protein